MIFYQFQILYATKSMKSIMMFTLILISLICKSNQSADRSYPLVLARTHKCIYVCPVGFVQAERSKGTGTGAGNRAEEDKDPEVGQHQIGEGEIFQSADDGFLLLCLFLFPSYSTFLSPFIFMLFYPHLFYLFIRIIFMHILYHFFTFPSYFNF